MSDPLFKEADEFENTFVGEKQEEQPNLPPRMPNPAMEHGMMTTPPSRADEKGVASQPFFQGAEGDNALSEAPKYDGDVNPNDEA